MEPERTLRLHKLSENELDKLYNTHIEVDFPRNERPSRNAMHYHMQEGLQEVLLLYDGAEPVAYTALAQANGVVLITLLAVFADKRNQGYGTTLLTLLTERYADKRAMALEVEVPQDAADSAERAVREKRISFYQRSGFHLLEHIKHIAFDVPLMLMSQALCDTDDGVAASAVLDIAAIYDIILPGQIRGRVRTARKKG